MDSPNPSRVTTLTTLASSSMTWEKTNSEASPPAIEAMAPAIGIPAATNPPKTNTMTTKDSGRAMPSPARRSVSIWCVIASRS
jgi:hypothetical protein